MNVAVIGAGIGGSHIEGFLAHPDKFNVAMICDLDLERADKARGSIENCEITTDIAAVLRNPDIDLVCNCLPPHLHYPVMMDALRADKNVVCEKPFTTSLAEADAVVALAEQRGKQVFPVFQYRYGHGYQKLLHLIEQDMVGKPYTAALETHWQRGDAYYAVPWRGTWASERGGAIVGHAIHIHNLVCCALGPVAQVAAFLDTRVNDIETDDCGAISLKMQSGALVTSSITLGAANDSSRLRLCFEHVTAQSDVLPYSIGDGSWTFTATDPNKQQEIDAAVATVPEGKLRFSGLYGEIYGALTGRSGANPPNMQDARHSIELISAIYQSSRNSEVVSLPLGTSSAIYNGWVPSP
ncbi:MAG: Gfo/Idh/MocA family oxidoreductase [Rhodobacteraceae bacterium]|nr:Gfo/Idh/MocA family oxidoreductase [Paracoccaceae bacterium]